MNETHYPNAPIIEAIIDIRAAAADTTTEAAFDGFAAALQEDFPQTMPLYTHQFTFDAANPDTPEVVGGRVGVRVVSSDRKRQALVNREGFAFSILAPYTRWPEFLEAAQPVWNAYIRHFQPTAFLRIAVRYVNLFRFTERDISLPRFFTVYPQIEAIARPFYPVELRAQIALSATTSAVVTQFQMPSLEHLEVLLDLDVFQESELPANAAAAWACLNPLREHKNWLFQQCLTHEGERRIQ